MMEFKDKLIQVRAILNITQCDLARELNVSFQTINRWERGKVYPTRKAEIQLENLCKIKHIEFKRVVYNEEV